MKNLLIMILFFAGLTGCSDYPSEPTIVYRSAGVKNTAVASDKNKTKDPSPLGKSGGESWGVNEHEFNAAALIKEDMSFEVHKEEEFSKLHFISPLENNLSTRDAYHMEIQFLEPQRKAMKHLKIFLAGNQDVPHFYKVSVRRLCYAVGVQLIGSGDGRSSYFKCRFDMGEDADYQRADFTGGTIKGLYTGQSPISEDNQIKELYSESNYDRIKNLRLKYALILFQKAKKSGNSSRFDVANPRGLDEYDQYDFGYRCLLDKRASKKDENLVKYHKCRYPRGKEKKS